MLIFSSFHALGNSQQMLEKCNKLFDVKHYDQAINCYDDIIKLEPKNAEIYFSRA